MAIRKTQSQEYLRVIHPLSVSSREAVANAANACDNLPAAISVTVNIARYKNKQYRLEEVTDPYITPICESRQFDHLPMLTDFVGTEPDKMKAIGYALLLESEEFGNAEWEAC